MIEHGPVLGEILLLDFSPNEHGHREQYNSMLVALFNTRRVRFGWSSLWAQQPILVPAIESSPSGFALLCLIRAIIGRRTVGFLMRPLPVIQAASLRHRIKGAALKMLKRMRGNVVLTIIPFAVEPRFAQIANDWIYDLQNWDMQLAAPANEDHTIALASQVRAAAIGRQVCCAIGRQDEGKGFHRFARLFCGDPVLRSALLFAYGGLIDPSLKREARQFAEAGGFGLDRFVSDAELLGLYCAADLVWCVYGPDYDQASGILGRAMQMGLPVVVRRGSVIERICELERHPFVSFDAQSETVDLSHLPKRLPADQARARARLHGAISLARLSRALGVKPVNDPFVDA